MCWPAEHHKGLASFLIFDCRCTADIRLEYEDVDLTTRDMTQFMIELCAPSLRMLPWSVLPASMPKLLMGRPT